MKSNKPKNLFVLFQAEPFLASLVSADNFITLLSDVIAILSHVARSSSEYVSMVTNVLQGDRGERKSKEILCLFSLSKGLLIRVRSNQ